MKQEEVITELQRVASLLGKHTLSMREFRRNSRIDPTTAKNAFGSWNKAIESAGLMTKPSFKEARLSDQELEAEFRRVQQLLGKTPTQSEFAAHGRISFPTYCRKFGRWSKAVEHYTGRPAAQRPAKPTAAQAGVPVKPARVATGTSPSATGKRLFGPPLNFRELRHEPVNEQGVVYTFGMVARELGFLVEAIGTGYPDCTAKRQVKGGGFVPVNIEFEFKSSNFHEHGHNATECDLIVCWEDDWPKCPVEILELKSAIRRLGANG